MAGPAAHIMAGWLAALVAGLLGPTTTFAQRATYDILKGGEVVGSIAASRTELGDRTVYIMTSYSILDLVWEQAVSTAMSAEYDGDLLRSCRSTVHVNGDLRDSSHMVPEGDRHRCYVHPRKPFLRDTILNWTTARMYFEEPRDQQHIFVESVLEPCAIRALAPGTYLLTFPNGAQNRYVYVAGALQEIQVDRTFLDLVFRRRPG